MIREIIDLLGTSDWNVKDEDIDIAKGKYLLVLCIEQALLD